MRSCHGLLVLLMLAWSSRASAQPEPCVEELRVLQELQLQIRAQVLAGNTAEALALTALQKLETPAGYDFENDTSCQKWALAVADAHRGSCSFELARQQLGSIKTGDARAIDKIRSAQERLKHASIVPYTCKDRKNLYLLCTPAADTEPEAWCARDVASDQRLEFPRHAWCKLIDQDGVEQSTVSEPAEPTCREEVAAQERAQRLQMRAERRGTVASSGLGIATMAAIAVPLSFVPAGMLSLLQRLGALEGKGERMRHRSFRARQRVLPLLGVTALSVASLSSRFWWAGVLTAGCGVSADVLLAQHWHHHDKTRRSIGITTAVVGAVAGALLNLETMGYSDSGPRYAVMPTLNMGVAQAELGLAGSF